MTVAATRRKREPEPAAFAGCNAECEARVTAAKIIAASNHEIAHAITGLTVAVGPLNTSVVAILARAEKLCVFLRRWFLPLLFSTPGVLAFAAAVTPEMAKAFHNLLKTFGLAP